MLIVSKVKLLIARFLFWGGLVVAVVGGTASFYALIGGLAVGFLGAMLLDKIYSCPNCGFKLLRGGSRMDSLKEDVPTSCPNCRTAITVQKK